MNNNIFATFMLGKVEEQLEIDCKAFSTAEKQNEEFEKILISIFPNLLVLVISNTLD